MLKGFALRPPFFEIGPKSYLFGDDILTLALAADAAAKEYDVDVLFTTPLVDIRRVAEAVERVFVFAPHMHPIRPGRGLTEVLAESLVAAGAKGVMLNHCEAPVTLAALSKSISRADEVGLATIVCTDTAIESQLVAELCPNIIVAEPTELIGTGKTSDEDYVKASTEAIKRTNPDIFVLQAAGISSGKDVYRVIYGGAEATGCSSGIAGIPDESARIAMVYEMIGAVRRAWDDRTSGR